MHLIKGKAIVRFRPKLIRRDPLTDIMRVGGIGLINSVSMALTVAVITGVVGHFGTDALGGYGLGSRLELLLIPFVFGIGAALTAAAGANISAQQLIRARYIA